jgi:hypothetical protein
METNMQETIARGAGLETPRASAHVAPLSTGTHPIVARLARHACRAYLKARRLYVLAEAEQRAFDDATSRHFDGLSDSMVTLCDGAERACLTSILAMRPGISVGGGLLTTDRGNCVAVVDGRLFVATWDEEASYQGVEGRYRLTVVEGAEVLDLTSIRGVPMPPLPASDLPEESPPLLLSIVARPQDRRHPVQLPGRA